MILYGFGFLLTYSWSDNAILCSGKCDLNNLNQVVFAGFSQVWQEYLHLNFLVFLEKMLFLFFQNLGE